MTLEEEVHGSLGLSSGLLALEDLEALINSSSQV